MQLRRRRGRTHSWKEGAFLSGCSTEEQEKEANYKARALMSNCDFGPSLEKAGFGMQERDHIIICRIMN